MAKRTGDKVLSVWCPVNAEWLTLGEMPVLEYGEGLYGQDTVRYQCSCGAVHTSDVQLLSEYERS